MRARTLHLLAVAADELICPIPCRTDYRRNYLVIRSLAENYLVIRNAVRAR